MAFPIGEYEPQLNEDARRNSKGRGYWTRPCVHVDFLKESSRFVYRDRLPAGPEFSKLIDRDFLFGFSRVWDAFLLSESCWETLNTRLFDFCKEYGPLTAGIEEEGAELRNSLADQAALAFNARTLVEAIKTTANSSKKTLWRVEGEKLQVFSYIAEREQAERIDPISICIETDGEPERAMREELGRVVDNAIRNEVRLALRVDSCRPEGFELEVQPRSPLGAAWLLFAQMLGNQMAIQFCPQCTESFPVYGTALGRQQYCNEKCTYAAKNARRAERNRAKAKEKKSGEKE